MRMFSHENLNNFVGIAANGPSTMAVWQFAGKGTLYNLFEKDNFTLDWFFKFSLIRDLSEVRVLC